MGPRLDFGFMEGDGGSRPQIAWAYGLNHIKGPE